MRRIITSGAILLLILTLGLSTFASAAGSQTWYLDDTVDTPPPGWADYLMSKTVNTDDTSVDVASGSSVIWRADEASTGVTFPAGAWEAKIGLVDCTSSDNIGTCADPFLDDITVKIGSMSHGAFTSVAEATMSSGSGRDCSKTVTITAPSFTVEDRGYLGLKIINDSDKCVAVIIGNESKGSYRSRFSSPTSDPGYPVPELAAGVLLALGLGGLSTYITMKRRQNSAAHCIIDK